MLWMIGPARSRAPPERCLSVFSKMSSNLRGILYMIAATMFLTSMSSMARALTDDMHALQIAALRNVFGLVLMAPVLLRAGKASIRTNHMGLMAGRGFLNAIAMVSFFIALGMIPLAEVSALNFTVPLFVTLMAIFFLGEKITKVRIIGLLAGFAGALIVIRPGLGIISGGAVYAMIAAASWAGAVIIIKRLSRTDSSVTITFYALVFLTVFTLPPSLFVWKWPTLEQYLILALIALCGTVGQVLFAQSMKSADATLVMPFDFSKLIWASLFGYFLFSEVPTLWVLLGGTVIFASATWIALAERNAARAVKKKAEKENIAIEPSSGAGTSAPSPAARDAQGELKTRD